MEVVAAFTPVTPLPFSDGRDNITTVFYVLLESYWNLPAHVWFPVHMALAGFFSSNVERTTGAAFKARRVVEDTGAINDTCFRFTIFVGGKPALVFCLGLVLPMLA